MENLPDMVTSGSMNSDRKVATAYKIKVVNVSKRACRHISLRTRVKFRYRHFNDFLVQSYFFRAFANSSRSRHSTFAFALRTALPTSQVILIRDHSVYHVKKRVVM